MQYQWIRNDGLRRRAIAVLCAALPVYAFAQAMAGLPTTAAAAPPKTGGAAGRQQPAVYSVINVGPAGATALLNERGQAAFHVSTFSGTSNGFFDGDRVRDIGSLGGGYTRAEALNNHGVVVGTSRTPGEGGEFPAFAWTPAGGMRALAGAGSAVAFDINDRNEIVGQSTGERIVHRALRWNVDGSLTVLARPEFWQSAAYAINDHGYATGFENAATDAFFPKHAMLWDRAGKPDSLGSLGRDVAAGRHINERNEVVGEIYHDSPNDIQAFFWSRDSGMVPIRGVGLVMAGLNKRGEAIGNMLVDGLATAFQWSLGRGLVPLPLGPAVLGAVSAINDHGEMVGRLVPPDADRRARRAALWPGLASPVDLNARLHRPPVGLVLESAEAINGDGVILAQSNAGLVMLRPGQHGTDAPVLGPIAGLPVHVEQGRDLTLTLAFADNSVLQTHTASAAWSDGCPSPAPAVTEAGGIGQVRLRHVFCAPGAHTVEVRVTDSGGRFTDTRRDFLVDAPALTVSGKGASVSDGSGQPAAAGR